MPVGLHHHGAAVSMPDPARNGGNIDTGFDAPRAKDVAETVVRDPHYSQPGTGSINGFLGFLESE